MSEKQTRICGECEYAELQCPPVIRCQKHSDFRYLDSTACTEFTPVEDLE